MLNEVLGSPGNDLEIEDIIGSEYLLAAVTEVVGRPFDLDDNVSIDRVTVQIKNAAERQGVSLPPGWKASAAMAVVSSWAKMTSGVENRVLEDASRLFTAIHEGFDALHEGE